MRRARVKLRKLPDQNWNGHGEILRIELTSLCPEQRQGDEWIHCQRTENSPSAGLLNSRQILTAASVARVGTIVQLLALLPSLQSVLHHGKDFPKGLLRPLGDPSSTPHL